MTTWYDYMVRASEHAGSDGDLWFRYLYKVIKDEETKLTTRCFNRRYTYKRTRFAGEP